MPAKYDPAKATPLLFAFHGGGGNIECQADDSRYKLISKSEEAGFIAVFPNGFSRLKSGKIATWNAGKCCAAARDQNIDDVGFVKEVVARVSRQLNIDSKRIFATGMSNGAMVAYRVACELSDTFAAIAAVAGTDNTKECAPKRIPSIVHIHAKNDDHVLFQGGAGPKAQKQSVVTAFASVAATIEKWVKFAGCGSIPKRVLAVDGNAGAFCDLYTCRDNARVQLCVTETGGHSWPGGTKNRGDERPSNAISATDAMWDLFSSQQGE